jgi:nucleotide-binding universal stress UspA family protein
VSLVAVVEDSILFTGIAPASIAPMDAERASLTQVLEERAEGLRARRLNVETFLERGDPARVLREIGGSSFADLIVVGSRGRGPAASTIFGSVSASLVDHAPCPVLVARAPDASRMLLATDGTPSSSDIPRILAAWGSAFRGLPAVVLSVSPHDTHVSPWSRAEREAATAPDDLADYRERAERMAEEMRELGWAASALTLVGDPVAQILSIGSERGADLIVTGSRGIGPLRRVLEGSVAHDVVLHTHSSVLVVRGVVPAHLRRAVPVLGELAPS